MTPEFHLDETTATRHEYLDIAAGPLSQHERDFEGFLRRIGKFHPITSDSEILEVGVGTGWFLIMCALRGFKCRGIELNPLFANYARTFGREHGIELQVEVGTIEDVVLDAGRYDVVLATSVFEHVQRYEEGIQNVYRSLKPGGVFYFHSTNRFSLKSGEYPALPLYGWLPNRLRYRFRVWRQGDSIVRSSGIDFNQFTYWQLRRVFRRVGFSRVMDRVDFMEKGDIVVPRAWKSFAIGIVKKVPLSVHRISDVRVRQHIYLRQVTYQREMRCAA